MAQKAKRSPADPGRDNGLPHAFEPPQSIEKSLLIKLPISMTGLLRYGGNLIHHDRDAQGVLEVVEKDGVRSLHFGTASRQSAMSLSDPDRLELAYIRAMLSALLWVNEPEEVLILGLGGGSLSRFLLRQFPRCRLDVVELRLSVVNIARNYFHLPEMDRLSIHVGDAHAYVARNATLDAGKYSLILVDAYDRQGMEPAINTEEFFQHCQSLLAPSGILSINLWGTHRASLHRSYALLKTYFPRKAYRLSVFNKGNIIGLGLGDELENIEDTSAWQRRAMLLESRLDVEMRYFLQNFRLI
jgi:spermidine synthase